MFPPPAPHQTVAHLFARCFRLRYSVLSTAIVLLPVLCSADSTPQRVAFRQRAMVGESWTFEQAYDTVMNTTLSSDDKQAQQVSQTLHQVRSGTMTVSRIGDTGVDALRISFDAGCLSTIEQTGQIKREVQFPLAGMTITVKRTSSGEIEHDFKGKLDEQTLNELAGMLEPENRLFPPQAVAMGDTWPIRKSALERHFQLKENDRGAGQATLDSTKMIAGRPVADIVLGMNLVKMQEGFIKTEIKLKGAARIDLSSGHTTAGVLDGPLILSGSQLIEQNGRQVRVKVTGDGQVKFRSVCKWLAVGAPMNDLAALASPEPVVADSHEPASSRVQAGGGIVAVGGVAARVPPSHPVVPRHDSAQSASSIESPADSFTGSFRDDTLRVELQAGGDQVAGSIRMGAQRFPLRGRIESGQVIGTFETDGNVFGFIAKFDGGTLVLTTDNTPYRLQRQRNNPLARTE